MSDSIEKSSPFSYGNKYCQHDEENVVLHLLDHMPFKASYTLCDIGARLRLSNCRRLIEDYGYSGTLVDANPNATKELERIFVGYDIDVQNVKVGIHNVEEIVPSGLDFLSIDIDTNDYWIWATIKKKPKIVCIEFNNHFEGLRVAPYDFDMDKGGGESNHHCASLDAMVLLGENKGYDLFARTGTNAIFVRRAKAEES